MEEWQKDFFKAVESVTEEVERFFQGVSETVETLWKLSEEITEQIQSTVAIEVEQYINDIAEPLFDFYWEIEEIINDTEPTFPYRVEPTQQKNPACIGCRHYHGQVYGGNLLVCAMHPHGWDDASCPDWEEE